MYQLQSKDKEIKNSNWITIKKCIRENEIRGYYNNSKKISGHFHYLRIIDKNNNVMITTEDK
jgi:hypothetical protein